MKRLSIILAAAMAASPSLLAQGVTLDECVKTALEASPDVLSAQSRLTAAKRAADAAEAAYYPFLSLGASFARTDNPPQAFMMSLNQRTLNMADPAFDPNNPTDTDNVRGSVILQYRLFDPARGHLAKMADLSAEAAAAAKEIASNQLVFEVTRGFYRILQVNELLKVHKKSAESIKESLRVANERLNAGSSVKTDVLNLEVQLAQANEDVIRANNMLKLSIAVLNTAIGKDTVSESRMPAGKMPEFKEPKEAPDQSKVDMRPEIKIVSAVRDIKTRSVKKSKSEYYPSVNAFGSQDWDSESATDFEQSYMIGINAEFKVFDGFLRSSQVKQAKAELEAASADEIKARSSIKLDILQAHLGLKEAWERIQVTGKSQKSAEEALRITQERYKSGSADIAELLNTQVGHTAMQTRNISAMYDYLIAENNLKRACGELGKYEYTRSAGMPTIPK